MAGVKSGDEVSFTQLQLQNVSDASWTFIVCLLFGHLMSSPHELLLLCVFTFVVSYLFLDGLVLCLVRYFGLAIECLFLELMLQLLYFKWFIRYNIMNLRRLWLFFHALLIL